MTRRVYEVLLSLGSNIEPERHVEGALRLLEARFDVVAVSPRVHGPAIGGSGPHPPFVNLAVRLRTDLPPPALREVCRRIEEACGRTRTADRYAPRTLDLDVVFGDPAFTRASGGAVPDADLLEHGYVGGPCAAVWPDAVHPATGRTLAAHARAAGWPS